jgi:hypothetical protein
MLKLINPPKKPFPMPTATPGAHISFLDGGDQNDSDNEGFSPVFPDGSILDGAEIRLRSEGMLEDSMDGIEAAFLNAMDDAPKTPQGAKANPSPGGCFAAIFNGKCAAKNCVYRHDEQTLRLTWEHYWNKLKSSPYSMKAPGGGPSPVHHTPARGLITRPESEPRFNSESKPKPDINQQKGRTFMGSPNKVLASADADRKSPDDPSSDDEEI